MRRPCDFKLRNVTRAAKAVRAAGLDVLRVEIDKEGRIIVVVKAGDNNGPANDLDKWMAKNARAS